ncbi:ogr/Delta-like zinc finger family protein [Escherichia coli]|uniref:ogr/Delta-like zinc finger family protein n=1 Tax=Escherichia coli TaxID=562 RepID=UPI000A19DFA5
MRYPCPLCGSMAFKRTSEMVNRERTLRRGTYQCKTPECGVTFCTYEVVKSIIERSVPEAARPLTQPGTRRGA